MNKTDSDKTLKIILIWIAVMLTILSVDKLFKTPLLFAQAGITKTKPIEIVIKEPVPVRARIVEWSGNPQQPIKVKIDDPWPARIEIKDEVKVKGEIRLKK